MHRDGNLYCKFERATQFVLGNQKMDLSSQMYYLLLARGLASSEGISYHGGEKTVSARSLKLSETGVVGASRGDVVVNIHSSYRVLASTYIKVFLQLKARWSNFTGHLWSWLGCCSDLVEYCWLVTTNSPGWANRLGAKIFGLR